MDRSRLIIKICGITNRGDARMALDAGADWIGLNLVGGPRRIELAKALDIASGLDDASAAVPLVSVDDADHEMIVKKLAESGVRRLQLYGAVADSHFAALAAGGLEVVLVRHVGKASDAQEADSFLCGCKAQPSYILIDAHVAGQQGGTGQKADWRMLAEQKKGGQLDHWPPILLAGGLNPENVTEAVARVQPAGVDVSSGVESSPGIKDIEKVQAFVSAARLAFFRL